MNRRVLVLTVLTALLSAGALLWYPTRSGAAIRLRLVPQGETAHLVEPFFGKHLAMVRRQEWLDSIAVPCGLALDQARRTLPPDSPPLTGVQLDSAMGSFFNSVYRFRFSLLPRLLRKLALDSVPLSPAGFAAFRLRPEQLVILADSLFVHAYVPVTATADKEQVIGSDQLRVDLCDPIRSHRP